jgi:hypothetical protein
MFDDIYPPNGYFQGPDRGAMKDSPARMLACCELHRMEKVEVWDVRPSALPSPATL